MQDNTSDLVEAQLLETLVVTFSNQLSIQEEEACD
jgi:hypothetical protein